MKTAIKPTKLKCKCGSTLFEPLGIQEGWRSRKPSNRPRVLFLVNCVQCGTTLACHRLNYALLRNDQVQRTLSDRFFTHEETVAA